MKRSDPCSGHAARETRYLVGHFGGFPLRLSWLPRLVDRYSAQGRVPSNLEEIACELGIGKNMAKALRAWARAAGLLQNASGLGLGRRGNIELLMAVDTSQPDVSRVLATVENGCVEAPPLGADTMGSVASASEVVPIWIGSAAREVIQHWSRSRRLLCRYA